MNPFSRGDRVELTQEGIDQGLAGVSNSKYDQTFSGVVVGTKENMVKVKQDGRKSPGSWYALHYWKLSHNHKEYNGDTILCFSGGIDSFAAYHYLGKPRCIYFNCSRYSEAELPAVIKLNPETIISEALDFTEFDTLDSGYILHRNLMFAAIASNYASEVVMAGVKDDMVRDKSRQAFQYMSDTLCLTSKKLVHVSSPFWDMTKSEVVGWVLKNVPNGYEGIMDTVSCYNNERYCGACPSCFRKANALWDNGIKLIFDDQILMDSYLMKALEGKYIQERNDSIKRFVTEHLEWLSST